MNTSHAEIHRQLRAVRGWMRMWGHHERLPRLYDLLDSPRLEDWFAAAEHCVEIARFMDDPAPEDRERARRLRVCGTTECLGNVTQAIARALTLVS